MKQNITTHAKMKSQRMKEQEIISSLQERAEEVLLAVAILGLVASIADGDPDSREIDLFKNRFRKSFLLPKSRSLRIIHAAMKSIVTKDQAYVVENACDVLNQNLTTTQRLSLFDVLVEIVLSDGRIFEGEDIYLDYIAGRLQLITAIESRISGKA